MGKFDYRPLTVQEKVDVNSIKNMGEEFINFLQTLTASRENSIAKTKIEEAVMWAVKGITK